MPKRKDAAADVAIAGGGFVGLALALALAGPEREASGLEVTVLDAAPAGGDERPDQRASAITAASRRMLMRLGAWGGLDALAQPVAEMVITDSRLDEAARVPFLVFQTEKGAVDGTPAAWIAENAHLAKSLRKAVGQNRHIAVRHGARVTGFARDGAGVAVETDGGGSFRARLLVAAAGAGAGLDRLAGIRGIAWDYDQWALVATIRLTRDHAAKAVQHFLPAGPFAMLPLRKRRGSLVWTEKREEAQRLIALDEPAFIAELTRRLGHRFGTLSLDGPRQGFPLGFFMAREFVAERFALAGDAAHRFHPLAGQGVNLGFKDAAALAETAIEATRIGLDIGSLAVLERYQRWRRFDAAGLALATDGLNRLFSNDSDMARIARDVGLGLVERWPDLKRAFVREAAGDTGTLPRLLRGEPV
jgi:2-octaprenyl-6-methoxyphenol hydroxylase